MDEEEYQPTYDYQPASHHEESKDQNSGYPLGFGAERANLMQEQAIYMPEQTHQQITTEAPSQSYDQSQRAKNQLLEEISKITTQSADHMIIKESEFSAEQMHFTVTNPTKVGSVIKYSVVG